MFFTVICQLVSGVDGVERGQEKLEAGIGKEKPQRYKERAWEIKNRASTKPTGEPR